MCKLELFVNCANLKCGFVCAFSEQITRSKTAIFLSSSFSARGANSAKIKKRFLMVKMQAIIHKLDAKDEIL